MAFSRATVRPLEAAIEMARFERQKWVVSTHCRLAASGKRNSTGRFPAINCKSGLTKPDPKQTNVESLSRRRFPRTQQPFVAQRCLRSSHAPSRCPGTNREIGRRPTVIVRIGSRTVPIFLPVRVPRISASLVQLRVRPNSSHRALHSSLAASGTQHSPDPPALRNEVVCAANPLALRS